MPFFDIEGIPKKRKRVLIVSALPQCRDLNLNQKAELAGVSVRYWSQCHGLPDFKELAAKMSRQIIGAKVFDTTHAFIDNALNGNVVAQQSILRQCDVLDKDNGNGSGASVTVNIAIVQQERQERMGKSLERFGYEVAAEPEEGK